jgi:glycosyltransferase involved in cell wall biosynthesis
LVHTSTKPEPFGRVLIEAMAVGTPVVAAWGGGTPEIVTDGVTGRLVAPLDLNGYVGAIETALAVGRSKWVRAASQAVTKHFSLDRVVADFDRLLRSASFQPAR